MTKRKVRVVAAQIERDGRYMITQRKPTSSLPLLWEFPGGRVEEGESDEAALARELKEEMDVEVKVGEASVRVTHEYEAYTIDFRVYRCELLTPEEDIKTIGAMNWEKGYKGPGLCEYYLRTGDASVLPVIRQMAVKVAPMGAAALV